MRISDWSSDVCSSDLVAVLAEVSINKDQGIDVDRIFCAVDCGRVVNPDLVRQQIEGGIIFALSGAVAGGVTWRSEEHTSELQSLMRISYAVFCLKKKKK